MREIKFRVWDKVNKSYKQDTYHSCPDINGIHEIGVGGDYVLQQFTGLQDSKGVDIYEGDVLEGNSRTVRGLKLISKFNKGCFMGELLNGDGYIHLYFMVKSKIVGNINENPELLQ